MKNKFSIKNPKTFFGIVILIILLGVVYSGMGRNVPKAPVGPSDVVQNTQNQTMKGFDSSPFFMRKGDKVYYMSKEIVGADANTFTVLGGAFSKDKNYVYRAEKKVTEPLDLASVEVIDGGNVIKDSQRVYLNVPVKTDVLPEKLSPVSGVDAKTFQYVGICSGDYIKNVFKSYYKDKNRIYINEKAIDTIDFATFQYLRNYEPGEQIESVVEVESYAKDKNHVYSPCGQILVGANPKTFNGYDSPSMQEFNPIDTDLRKPDPGGIVITSISPSSGPVGTIVTLNGLGIKTGVDTYFNITGSGEKALSPISVSPETVTFAVPEGIPLGEQRVHLLTSERSTPFSNEVLFTVTSR
jgi:hypothetical protein